MANYPVPYQNSWGYGGIGQQMFPQYPQTSMVSAPQMAQQTQGQQGGMGLKWVDGEVGAKAFQLPAGWPCNQPVALWDTNDTVIYLKSINPMGMPNPLQKARYVLETGTGASSGQAAVRVDEVAERDLTQYVKKDDMEQMKQEIMEAISSANAGGTAGARKTATKGE